MSLNAQDLDETLTVSLRMLKDGTEQLNGMYQVSPGSAYGISHDGMRDPLERSSVKFTASNTSERERREFPNRLGRGCYSISPHSEQLLVFTGYSRKENCGLS